MPDLTVTEAALVDLERQREAFMARAKNYDGAEGGDRMRLVKELGFDPRDMERLAAPVQIKLTFDDPMKLRAQLEVLAGAIEEAKALTYDHNLGIMKQRVRARRVMKEASDTLTYMRGQAPSGKHRASKSSDE